MQEVTEKRCALDVEVSSELARFESFLRFKPTDHSRVLERLPHNVVGIFAGNQGGKTSTVAYDYVKRILGLHPIREKNVLSRKIRCLSSSLPDNADADAQDNTQYLEFKKLLPRELILQDISNRIKTVIVRGCQGNHYIEFMSTKQELQDTGKVQRDSLWMDEEAPKAYYEESRMRLSSTGGDTRISLTPINGISWVYDNVWEQANFRWRSQRVADALGLPKMDVIESGNPNVACIQIATDDNPTFDQRAIDMIFESVDPEEVAVRRYGVFKQITGRVHKAYSREVHFVSMEKYFPDGIPYPWIHCRGIDYHESRIPWSVGWLSVSPDDEWFLWQEFHPAIDGPHAMNTYEIVKSIMRKSGDYYFDVNLIDPLANKKQANTLMSTVEDINRYMDEIHRDYGYGTVGYWRGWDTKDTKGRDEIKKRLKNAMKVGKPFNNKYMERGEKKRLPTLWICDTCPKFDESIRKWSFEEWATAQGRSIKDPKVMVQQKYSHDNMVLECLAKDHRLRPFTRPVMSYDRKLSPTGRGYGVRVSAGPGAETGVRGRMDTHVSVWRNT